MVLKEDAISINLPPFFPLPQLSHLARIAHGAQQGACFRGGGKDLREKRGGWLRGAKHPLPPRDFFLSPSLTSTRGRSTPSFMAALDAGVHCKEKGGGRTGGIGHSGPDRAPPAPPPAPFVSSSLSHTPAALVPPPATRRPPPRPPPRPRARCGRRGRRSGGPGPSHASVCVLECAGGQSEREGGGGGIFAQTGGAGGNRGVWG